VFVSVGDPVLILGPSYDNFRLTCQANGAEVYWSNYTDDFKFNSHAFEEDIYKYDPAIVYICNPNNPTGKCLSRQEADEIEQFMLAHKDIILISDEIYERIIFDGNSNISPASYESIRDRVVIINGFSKATAMTGWRCGYLATTPEIAKVIYKLYQHTISCVSGFIQKASVVALKCTDEIEQMRKKFEERRNLFIGGLNAIEGVSAKSPEGAFYAWVKFDWGMTSEEVCDYILNNAKVVAVPGIAYGTDEPFVRFSFAESDEKLAETVRRIAKIAPKK
jgi:aspartate aminotransferase